MIVAQVAFQPKKLVARLFQHISRVDVYEGKVFISHFWLMKGQVRSVTASRTDTTCSGFLLVLKLSLVQWHFVPVTYTCTCLHLFSDIFCSYSGSLSRFCAPSSEQYITLILFLLSCSWFKLALYLPVYFSPFVSDGTP